MENWLPDEKKRQLKLAAKLHKILVKNEESGKQRDDAKTFANMMDVQIYDNLKKGEMNLNQLIDDLEFYMIDQGSDFPLGYAIQWKTGVKSSNAAFNLGAGPRVGVDGWNEKYWDHGLKFDKNGRPINQVHHFVGFFTATLKAKRDPETINSLINDAANLERYSKKPPFIVDLYKENPQDIRLALLAIELGMEINERKLKWEDFSTRLYKEISSRY